MEFLKTYETTMPNAAITLARKVSVASLMSKVTTEKLKAALSPLQTHSELNFWDFGVRASPQLSINDSVKIICRSTSYSGQVVSKIDDPTGELGDLLGWTRQYKKPWKNICALAIHTSAHISKLEVETLINNMKQAESNFYVSLAPIRKPDALREGSITELTLTRYERNPANRRACLEHYGAACRVCDLDFGVMYGELGQDFIHVHHVTPLSQIREEHDVDPINDLIPVCPNCHAMLHINQGAPMTVTTLREIVAGRRA